MHLHYKITVHPHSIFLRALKQATNLLIFAMQMLHLLPHITFIKCRSDLTRFIRDSALMQYISHHAEQIYIKARHWVTSICLEQAQNAGDLVLRSDCLTSSSQKEGKGFCLYTTAMQYVKSVLAFSRTITRTHHAL